MKLAIKIYAIIMMILLAAVGVVGIGYGAVMVFGGQISGSAVGGVVLTIFGAIILTAGLLAAVSDVVFIVFFVRRMKGKRTVGYDITALVFNIVVIICGIVVALLNNDNLIVGILIVIFGLLLLIYSVMCIVDNKRIRAEKTRVIDKEDDEG